MQGDAGIYIYAGKTALGARLEGRKDLAVVGQHVRNDRAGTKSSHLQQALARPEVSEAHVSPLGAPALGRLGSDWARASHGRVHRCGCCRYFDLECR